MSGSRDWQSSFVTELTNDLRRRLREVENEATTLRRGPHDSRTERGITPRAVATRDRRVSARESLQRRVLGALEETPGVRASVLALSERRDAQELKELLEDLQAQGIVEQDGLGWRRADTASATL